MPMMSADTGSPAWNTFCTPQQSILTKDTGMVHYCKGEVAAGKIRFDDVASENVKGTTLLRV